MIWESKCLWPVASICQTRWFVAFSGQFSYFEALFERNDYHTEIISCCLLEAKKPIIFKKRTLSNLAKSKSYSLLWNCAFGNFRGKNRKRFNIEKWSRDEIMTRLNSHNARAIWWSSSTHRDITKQNFLVGHWWQIELNLTLRLVSCTSLWTIWIASPSGQTLTRVTSDLVGTTSSGTAGSTPAFVQIGTLKIVQKR